MPSPRTNGKDALIGRDGVAMGEGAAVVPAGSLPRPAAAPPAAQEPEVEVVRADDGTIRAITVRCTCGRQITLQCDYIEEEGHQDGQDS